MRSPRPVEESDPTPSDEELVSLCVWIKDAKGYNFTGYEKEPMRRSVRRLLRSLGVETVADLMGHLSADSSVFPRVLSGLTVTTSAMFRDPRVFRALTAHVFPYLKTYSRLKIWHAGCAQGEEVYSLAILLNEHGLLDRATIYATDINPRALTCAREGIYAVGKVKDFAKNYFEAGGRENLADYYELMHGHVRFGETLRSRILFAKHDLVEDTSFGEMQLIICRNVMIYFDSDLRTRVFSLFRESLALGGFLCLGLSEILPQEAGFEAVSKHDMIFRVARRLRDATAGRRDREP